MESWPKISFQSVVNEPEKKENPQEEPGEDLSTQNPWEKSLSPEEFIQRVDFDALNTIFDGYVRKSEGEQKATNTGKRLSAELVSLQTKEGGLSGGTDIVNGEMHIEYDPSRQKALDVLHALIHEGTHMRGGYSEEEWWHDKDFGKEYEYVVNRRRHAGLSESGYTSYNMEYDKQEGVTSGGLIKETALSLNEALTEDIALEVLEEYLRQKGEHSYVNDTHDVIPLTNAYAADREALHYVISAIAQESGIPPDDVRRGFVQAYMSGNTDVKGLLLDIQMTLKDDPISVRMLSVLAAGEPAHNTDIKNAREQGTESSALRNRLLKILNIDKILDALNLA